MTKTPPRQISAIMFKSRGAILTLIAIVILQSIVALYYIADGVDDVLRELGNGLAFEPIMECLIGFVLCAGIVFGSQNVFGMRADLRRQQAALDVARGALAAHISQRFTAWGLSPAESDVTLFALKGCSIAEIAKLRNAAKGTIRSQLSQVYAKAGVTSQSMLVSLFIEDLLQVEQGD